MIFKLFNLYVVQLRYLHKLIDVVSKILLLSLIVFYFVYTGPKVISRLLTVESIEEITDVLRRPPVIWDNLHANDYDQKRVFLGPYSGRSPDLIPKLRGVLTNPNCEYGANFVAIHTLAQWSRCNVDGKRDPSISECH